MFDRGHDQMAADTPTSRERAGDSVVHRARTGRGEEQLVGAAPHLLGGGGARGVEQQPGTPALAVQPGGVGPPLVQRGEQRLAGDRVQGSG